MSCSVTLHPDCNKKICDARDGKCNVTILYGIYINWGSPNRNPSRVMYLADLLKAEGYGVQLQYKEDNPQHKVSLIVDGAEVCKSDDLMHNRTYSQREANSSALVQALKSSGK